MILDTSDSNVAADGVNRFVTGALRARAPELQLRSMPLTRLFRAPLRGLTVALLASLAGACATRRTEAAMAVAPVASSVIWRIEEGDLIQTKVFQHPDLAAEPVVGANGMAFFPGLGRIHILGLSVDSLQTLLNARYATLVRNSNVQVTLQREITLYGQVRFPGVYPVDPGMTMLALMARAGGPAGSGSAPSATLERADGTRWSLARSARLGTVELHRNDAVYMAEESFFIRNSATIGATQVVMNLLATVVGLFVFISR